MKKRLNKKGFTLIELIIVIAILGILATLAIPRLFGFTESAREAHDEEIVAIVANAAILYEAKEGPIEIGTGKTFATVGAFLKKLADDDLVEQDYTSYSFKSKKYNTGNLNIINAAGDYTFDVWIDGIGATDGTVDAGAETDSHYKK